jgi:hypothetical protein
MRSSTWVVLDHVRQLAGSYSLGCVAGQMAAQPLAATVTAGRQTPRSGSSS